MISICTYTGTQKADFYIQSKGNYSGRPLKNPIRNCFAVKTNIPFAYEIVYCLFQARQFEIYIHGTCIPTIRITDVRKVINQSINKEFCNKKMNTVKKIDELIITELKKIEQLKELQMTLAHESIRTAQ